MPIATYAAYKASTPFIRAQLGKAATTIVAGRTYSRWLGLPAGAAPTTAEATSAATVGAPPEYPAGLAAWIKTSAAGRTSGGSVMLCDRLSHQGGLSGIVTTAQTTNLPTAALARYTSGVGVHMAFEIYTAVGATATTISVSYTNSAGVAGRTSPAIPFGGTGDNAIGRIQILPLQAGDVGVRSVESVTIGASTLTAGAFGITLFKPLLAIPCVPIAENANFDAVRDMGCSFEAVPADACLFQIIAMAGSSTFFTAGSINLIKQV